MEEAARVKEDIKNYWEQRANAYTNSPRATTDDVYLRKLEIASIVATLGEIALPSNTVLDVGSGDGYTTLHVAEALSHLHFIGVDYSKNMIQSACQKLATRPTMKERVTFRLGDATDLQKACADETYAIVITGRCLINLTSLESQRQAIGQIAKHTTPGGYYIAIENFVESQDMMNAMRRSVGLTDISIRWHNLFFKEAEFLAAAEPFFTNIRFIDFASSYYFATRVIYSAMCQMRGEEPDYEHEIHQLAVKLPPVGQFSPIRMAVLRRRQN